MAVNDIVKIVVEIVDEFSDEINKLEGRMQHVTRGRDAPVDIELRGLAKFKAWMKEATRPETKQITTVQTTLGGDVIPPDLGADMDDVREKFKRDKDSPFEHLKHTVRKILPTYHKWMQLIAVLLPMVIALGVALMGVATAMGAVVLAGGAMLGLGLLGGGDNMATAFENAKRQLQRFKQELFEVVQPLAKLFAPFTERFLALAPGQLAPLMRAAESLMVFQVSFERAFVGVVEWVAEAIDATAEYKTEIDDLIDHFAAPLGRGIIDFFRFVVEEAYENQDVLLALAGTFKQVLRAVYEFSLFLGQLAVIFSPVIEAVTVIAELFQQKWVVALSAAIATVVLLALALYRIFALAKGLYGSLLLVAMGINAIGGARGAILGIQAAITALNAQLTMTVALVGLATAGLALIAGGAAYYFAMDEMDKMERAAQAMGGNARLGGFSNSYAPAVNSGSSVTYNINIENVDKDSRNDVVSDIESFEARKNHRNTADPA